MLFVHLLHVDRINIGDSDRAERALSLTKAIEELSHGGAALFNSSPSQTALFLHEISELDIHLVVHFCRFRGDLETVEKSEPSGSNANEPLARHSWM